MSSIRAFTIGFAMAAQTLFAKGQSLADLDKIDLGIFKDPFYLLFFLIAVSLLPFLAIMMTSFAKIVVVLSIARQAIGTAQTPPNIVIMSLAIILTCYCMYPVGLEIYSQENISSLKSATGLDALTDFAKTASKPIRDFLIKHARVEDQELFFNLLKKRTNKLTEAVQMDDFIVLCPAFLISELTLAFQIGFLIYLPFLVIDMTIANLLMALGMQMLAPTTISIPFKILLFVLVDGFRILSEGFVNI
jgi:type III secretion protein R